MRVGWRSWFAYSSWLRLMSGLFLAPAGSGFLLLEHAKHALGHEKAAEHIDRHQRHRDDAEPTAPVEVRRAGREHRADQDDARDRIGQRHQRRMQRRRHVPYDVVADEYRQNEYDQIDDDRINA